MSMIYIDYLNIGIVTIVYRALSKSMFADLLYEKKV